MKINDIITFLEQKYPLENASDFDYGKIGLQLGSKNNPLKGILLTLDLNLDVINEAVQYGANLIIAHHPFIFNPLSKIEYDNPVGEIIKAMIVNNISLYVMHTNLDVGFLGVNDTLAKRIGFLNYQATEEDAFKENFLRTGYIQEQSLKDYSLFLKKALQLSGVRVAGNLSQKITKVAVIGGSGGKIDEINRAISLGCDLLVTGEISLNVAQYAVQRKFNLVEVSHGVERFVFDSLIEIITKEFKDIRIKITTINTDPFISL